MAGINLSQTEENIGKEKKESIFDTSLVISLIIFFLVAAGWGGLRYYISYLNKQVGILDANISGHNQELEGGAVDRIADLDMRLSYIAEKADIDTDPGKLFSQLESLMVPENSLVYYEYNKQDGIVTLQAKTDNYKHIAEQIISLKSSDNFSDVKVDHMERDKDGKIIFVLKAQL